MAFNPDSGEDLRRINESPEKHTPMMQQAVSLRRNGFFFEKLR
jgi:hypothetical protein